jgi:hypothetical protein
MNEMIEAGKPDEIKWNDGNWVFLDIGFSERSRSCGLLIGDERPARFRFGEAKLRIVEHIAAANSTTHLVVEAPLSVCFNKDGNPTGRRIEKEVFDGRTKTRYWHLGLGCGVMVAAMYLMRAIATASPKSPVRLFEGFVSYKDDPTDHLADVMLLRDVVKEPDKFKECIVSADQLAVTSNDVILSAFEVCGWYYGVPAVIKRQHPQRNASGA